MPRPLIFVHQYFAPELAGSAQQLTDLAVGLAEKGYEVQVVTGQPSYSSQAKLPRRESSKGILIHRVPKLQLSREKAAGRILSAASFFLAAFWKLLGMNPQALLVIGSDPPFLPLLGRLFNQLRGQRYVLILSDIYPEIAVRLGILKPREGITRFLEFSNRFAFQEAEKVIVLGETMAEFLKARFLHLKGRIEVIQNWADGNWIRPLASAENRFRKEEKLDGKLVILFSGNLGQIYDFEAVLEAAALLPLDSKIEFLFIGNGPLRGALEKEAAQRRLSNLRFLPYQPSEVLPYSLSSGDLAVIPLKRETVGLCVPGKLYYALAAGTPLLVIAPKECEASQIVLRHHCGWHLEPGHPERVAELLSGLVQNPHELEERKIQARACFETYFSREKALQQYETALSRL